LIYYSSAIFKLTKCRFIWYSSMTLDKASPGVTSVLPSTSVPKPASTLLGSDRVAALDWMKGFMMFWILYTHLGNYWGDGTWTSAWQTVWSIADWIPVGFVSFTVIGTMLSIKKKGNGRVHVTRPMMVDALKKFSYFFIVGTIINAVANGMQGLHGGLWIFLGMNIITAVAFAQLLVYGLIGLSQKQRIAFFFVLLASFMLLLPYCLNGLGWNGTGNIIITGEKLVTASAIVYFILFDMNSMMPTYGWLLATPLTMIVFDGIASYCAKKGATGISSPGDKERLVAEHGRQAKRLAISGLVLVVIAFLAGGFVLAPGIGGSMTTWANLTSDDPFRFWYLPGIPLIFYRFSPQYIVANVGIITMIFAALYRTRDKAWLPARAPTRMEVFGKYTFSMFVYSHLFIYAPLNLSIVGFVAILLPLLVVLVLVVQAWDKRADGILSLEWVLKKYLIGLNLVIKKIAPTSVQN
jgi:hypothetical protein